MDFTQWLLQLGTGGAVAALIFVFYRKDVKAYTELWKQQSEQLVNVVKENTHAQSQNTEVIRGLVAQMDRRDREQREQHYDQRDDR